MKARVWMSMLFATGMISLVLTGTAAAQNPPPPSTPPAPKTTTPAPAPSEPVADIAGGYSYLYEAGTGGADANKYNYGWIAAYSHKIGPVWAVGEATANYRKPNGEQWTLYAFQGGVRVPLLHGAHNLVLFAQALTGVEYFRVPGFSENGWSFQPGGGLDTPLAGPVKLRFQGDFRLAHEENTWFKEFRFGASVVFGIR